MHTNQTNADRSNAFASNAEFQRSNTKMRNFIAKNRATKKKKRIHSQSLQNILRTEHHGLSIINKHCSKFREFQR